MNINYDTTKFLKRAEYDKPHTLDFHGRGYYQCFCKTQTKMDNRFYTDEPRDEEAFCENYWSDLVT